MFSALRTDHTDSSALEHLLRPRGDGCRDILWREVPWNRTDDLDGLDLADAAVLIRCPFLPVLDHKFHQMWDATEGCLEIKGDLQSEQCRAIVLLEELPLSRTVCRLGHEPGAYRSAESELEAGVVDVQPLQYDLYRLHVDEPLREEERRRNGQHDVDVIETTDLAFDYERRDGVPNLPIRCVDRLSRRNADVEGDNEHDSRQAAKSLEHSDLPKNRAGHPAATLMIPYIGI